MPIRKTCDIQPPEWPAPSTGETPALQLKVVTPMFGGGYEARKVDDLIPIRPAAIRGQLRFWWRATAGAKYATAEELFRAEADLWGAAADEKAKLGPGKVSVTVRCYPVKKDSLVRIDKADVPDYARAILIQEKSETEKAIREQARRKRRDRDWVRQEIRNQYHAIQEELDELYPWVLPETQFTLGVTMRDGTGLPLDVLTAIKAFVLFGGVGGRTRRGFGCLHCENMPNELKTIKLPETSNAGTKCAGMAGCTLLPGSRLYLGTSRGDALEAWKEAIKTFHHFRKAELPGRRRPNSGTGSHSAWPEADMIRQLSTSPIAVLHSKHTANGNYRFPRADLGLPLKFQSQRSHMGYFGEAKILLCGRGDKDSRLASPVIVKPILLDGKWHPAMLMLQQASIASLLQLDISPSTRLVTDCKGELLTLWDGTNEVPFGGKATSVLEALEHYLLAHAKWTLTGVNIP